MCMEYIQKLIFLLKSIRSQKAISNISTDKVSPGPSIILTSFLKEIKFQMVELIVLAFIPHIYLLTLKHTVPTFYVLLLFLDVLF